MAPIAVSTIHTLDHISGILKRDLLAVKDGSLGKIRGYCGSCHEPIKENETITYTQGVSYHQEHFVCSACTTSLSNCPYVMHNDKAMCEPCYSETVLPKCAKCSQAIKTEMVTISNLKFHPLCLVCAACETPLAGKGVYSEQAQNADGDRTGASEQQGERLLCQDCYEDRHLPKCVKCKKSIGGVGKVAQDYLTVGEDKFHVDCFCCYDCGAKFEKGAHKGPTGYYCKTHWAERSKAAIAAASAAGQPA
ncbi:hypothetical protein BCR44DRAFT_1426897 [Catenaria anguillulae PL171]|uniref:LIM zinc-binding domain-containing protein n=1 Tax=Catenaria anguillulae PL171 TaxID=765915 RepID=A0A1Y2HYD1_9FUNG|nr:hypothetical protein BCR44DRAFT_1426897 [Catenaria anguillulae PL171]